MFLIALNFLRAKRENIWGGIVADFPSREAPQFMGRNILYHCQNSVSVILAGRGSDSFAEIV